MTAGVLHVGRGRKRKLDGEERRRERKEKRGERGSKIGRIRVKGREREGEGKDTFLEFLFHPHFINFSRSRSAYIPTALAPKLRRN